MRKGHAKAWKRASRYSDLQYRVPVSLMYRSTYLTDDIHYRTLVDFCSLEKRMGYCAANTTL